MTYRRTCTCNQISRKWSRRFFTPTRFLFRANGCGGGRRKRNGSAYLIVPACPPSLPALLGLVHTRTRSLQNLHPRHVRSSNLSRSVKIPAIHEPPRWSAYALSLMKGSLTGGVFHSCARNRSENCFLLGPIDEVVSRRRWSEGFESTGRQTEHLSELG